MASNSEDEDIRRAVALSLDTEAAGGSPDLLPDSEVNEATASSCTDETTTQTQPPIGIAGLDRKAMEEERLARLTRKRERPITPPPPRRAQKLDEKTTALPSGARLTFSTLVTNEQQSRKSQIANAAIDRMRSPVPGRVAKEEVDDEERPNSSKGTTGLLQYPHGVVKKTWAFGFDRTGNDVKLEEVLESRTLRTAVLSAFQWDVDWVLAKLKVRPNGGTTRCIFVMQAKDDIQRQKSTAAIENMRDFLRLCFPPMYGQINCMHSKLMLLFHSEKLRIAIPTANLLDFDWGETGMMENSVFMIDLPRLPNGEKAEHEHLPPFGKELLHYLEKQGWDQDVRRGVLNFDFRATEGMMFVHTVGGENRGEDAEHTGFPGLARAVRQLSLESDNSLQFDFAASSIGNLNDDQLGNLHAAACGENMIERAKDASTQAKSNFFNLQARKSSRETGGIRDNMRIYFPTHETVTSSIAKAAGTICINRRYYEDMRFPRTCFRDYRSIRKGLLSHNKILYARGKQTNAEGVSKDIAWCYVGSANMSESAWGKLVYDKKSKAWKMNCRNWECGVLLPVSQEKLAEQKSSVDQRFKEEKIEGEDSETESEGDDCQAIGPIVGMEVFRDLVPPPFEHPGEKYEGRGPWYFQE